MTLKTRCKELYSKYKETVRYLIFGVLTTVVSFALYYLLLNLCHMHYLWAQVISWVGAVIFAYVTNRIWVFESRVCGVIPIFLEFCSFTLSRLFSFGVETLLLWLMVDVALLSENIAKVPVAVVTVVLNYITGKLLVFRKGAGGNNARFQKNP